MVNNDHHLKPPPMKTPKTVAVMACVLLFYCSCASLSKSQLDEVNQFGGATKTFAVYPAKLMSALVDVHTQNQYYQVGIIVDPNLHRQHLDSIYKWIQTSAKKDEEISLVFQIINDYGQKLVHLTSNAATLQLDTAAQSFGSNIDSLLTRFNSFEPQHKVPTGYAAIIGEVVTFGGQLIYTRPPGKRGQSFLLLKAIPLIGMMATKLEQYLSSDNVNSIKAGISRERKDLVHNYTAYLASDNELINLYYKIDKQGGKDSVTKKDTVITGALKAWRSPGMGADSLYIKLLTNLDADETLRQQCLAAVESLRKAHHKLMLDLQEKKNLKDVYAELRDYGASLHQMHSTSSKIK